MSSVQQRLGSGEIPSEVFQEYDVLYFGEERYFCRRIPNFLGTSKSSQNMAVFSLRLKVPSPIEKELINCIWQFKIDNLYSNWRCMEL